MPQKPPVWKKDSVISHDDLNIVATTAFHADSWEVDTSTGLQFTNSGTGFKLGLVPQRVGCYAVVTQALTASSGLTLGKGKIALHYKDDSGTLQPFKDDDEDCFNAVPYAVAVGTSSAPAVVVAVFVDGDWVVVVAPCST